jgi:Putative Ig domain
MSRLRQSVVDHRRKIIPSVLAVALAAGFAVSVIATPNAQADYFTGCGYGYNAAAGGFGSGTGAAYQYGYLKNGTFGYGYGNEVCPLAVSTVALPGGTVGKSYSDTLTGTGGATPYAWTETGALPSGLTLSSAGAITGTPTAAGVFSFTVTMTDVNGQAQTSTLSITTAKAPKPKFRAIKVHGDAVVGRRVSLTITGVGFYGRPRVTSNERGTSVTILHDRGTQLVVRVRVAPRSRKGWHTFTIRLANGSVSRVNYYVR